MFTGIVQSQAEVYATKIVNNLLSLQLKTSHSFVERLQTGASIAVNGVCLTVVKYYLENNEAIISFDVIEETLNVSNLSAVLQGDRVNIERSLKVGDELGGHIVSGHVHCQSSLLKRIETSTNCTLVFALPEPWRHYVLAKGFITVNGISLTVGEVDDNRFSVHLIPETLARTNMSTLAVGNNVNIEFDQQTITIVRTIEKLGLIQRIT